jgi:hypothetical protein
MSASGKGEVFGLVVERTLDQDKEFDVCSLLLRYDHVIISRLQLS